MKCPGGLRSFLYGPAAKARLLRFENELEQMRLFRSALMDTIMAGGGALPFLHLRVRHTRLSKAPSDTVSPAGGGRLSPPALWSYGDGWVWRWGGMGSLRAWSPGFWGSGLPVLQLLPNRAAVLVQSGPRSAPLQCPPAAPRGHGAMGPAGAG